MADRDDDVAALVETAMAEFLKVQEMRVRALYNRQRAVFAEFLVAKLLPVSTVEADPAAPWDISWIVSGTPKRIQVKCSGEYLPHYPDRPAKALWNLALPRSAWNADSRCWDKIATYQCDAFVLARHTGKAISRGWRFAALSVTHVKGDTKIRERTLADLGIKLLEPHQLAGELRKILVTRSRTPGRRGGRR